MSDAHVRHKPVSKQDASAALIIGWARTTARHGKGAFADAIGVDSKTVSRAMAGETLPEMHTIMNSLVVDPTALNELFALYGFHPPRRREPAPANDLHTMAGLSEIVRSLAEALEDGQRDHIETLTVAESIRPVIPALTAIMNEAARIKGVAA